MTWSSSKWYIWLRKFPGFGERRKTWGKEALFLQFSINFLISVKVPEVWPAGWLNPFSYFLSLLPPPLLSKTTLLLLNPKRAIPVGKIASNIFLIFYRLQQKNPFYPFCSSRILLFRCIFWFHLVFSGSPMYFVFKVLYRSPFRAPGRITPFFY